MRPRRFHSQRPSAALALAALLAGCSGGAVSSPSPPSVTATVTPSLVTTQPSASPLSGTYAGSITDQFQGSAYQPRIGDLTVTLTGTTIALQGDYNQGFPLGLNPPQDVSIPVVAFGGSGNGSVTGNTFSGAFTAGSCSYTVTASLAGVLLKGSFSSVGCADSGSFSVSKS